MVLVERKFREENSFYKRFSPLLDFFLVLFTQKLFIVNQEIQFSESLKIADFNGHS